MATAGDALQELAEGSRGTRFRDDKLILDESPRAIYPVPMVDIVQRIEERTKIGDKRGPLSRLSSKLCLVEQADAQWVERPAREINRYGQGFDRRQVVGSGTDSDRQFLKRGVVPRHQHAAP